MSDEFYIGYETSVPRGSRRLVLAAAGGAIAMAAVLAAVLVMSQQTFADANFEFGVVKEFAGTVVADPYPTLLTDEGAVGLVAQGKHGAAALVRGFDGRAVKLRGTRIYRSGRSLVEVEAGTVTADTSRRPHAVRSPDAILASLAPVTLVGEIVDAKCYLGVMNPGEGTVHRDCAGICIRGGLPPMFASEVDGARTLLVMTTRDGRALGPAIAPLAGKRLVVIGRVGRDPRTGHWTLLADVEDYRLAR